MRQVSSTVRVQAPEHTWDGKQMTHFRAMAIFLLGSTLSAWLRFDGGAALVGWIVMLVCIAGVMLTWLREAKRAPPLVLPSEVEELGARDQLTPDEEQRFADALRAHHRQMQRDTWRELQRQGPAALIGPRLVFTSARFDLTIPKPYALPRDLLLERRAELLAYVAQAPGSEDAAALTDIDTPEALTAVRAAMTV